MPNQSPTSPYRTFQIVTIAALISLAGLAGCSESDESAAAVKQAGRSFTSIAAGDSTTANAFSEKTYRETEQLVSEFAGSESGYAQGAAITLSLAKIGQASLASQQASRAETESLQKARIVRGMINEWLTMSAIANAAGQFDPSKDIADINGFIMLRQDDIKQYQAQREQIESQIDDLDSQIADLRAKASSERNESGALELEMSRVSAAEAAKIVLQVREHTLRADQYQLESIRIEGVVGQLRPGAREIGLNVNKAESQVALLKKAQDELRARESASKNDAQQAHDAANAAAQRIDDAMNEYAQFRSEEVSPANDRAISLTRGAISALRDANSTLKQIASLTKASAQQTLAECYARQAAGYAEEAILYTALSEAGIPGDWSSAAQSASEAQRQAKTDSNDAFQSAAASLRGARVQGDERDKIEATAARLDLLGGLEPEVEEEYMDDSYEEDFDEDFDGSDDEEFEESSVDDEG
tara:strand:- start:169311 stop:170729 length:1419 start_codon:yes stop_codon:yes gene_type:complete